MSREISPRNLILIGFVLVLTGVILPALMVIQVIESNLFLNFLSHGASTAGMFLGLIGAAQYVHVSRKDKRNNDK